jgi:hydrogenase maturation protease
LVLCLGNDVRRDDGVAWKVAERLEASPIDGVVVRRSAVAGFYLIDDLLDFDRAIVVDAVRTGTRRPGEVFDFPVGALDGPSGPSPHAVGLPTVLRVGRGYGLPLPASVHVVAIEVADMETLATGLTPAVEAALPVAEAMVRRLLVETAAHELART